ncbi:MAG: putative PEP-binding protein [Geodermatophilaceae bacterium]
MDGGRGQVFEGAIAEAIAPAKASAGQPVSSRNVAETLATKLYVNLAVAEHAEQVAAMDVDGVGLLRAEFMVAGTQRRASEVADAAQG